MTHAFRQTSFPMKPIGPHRTPRRYRGRSIRPPRRLPEHLSSVLILKRLLLFAAVGLLLIGVIVLWRIEKSRLTGASQYGEPNPHVAKITQTAPARTGLK
jgi:hypothetical protein